MECILSRMLFSMKDVSTRLTFFAQGRRRRLYRKTPTGPFYVRFQHKGKDRPRCLGTTLEHVAKEKAKAIIEAEYVGDDETSRRLKLRSDYSTLRQVVDVYRTKYGQDARTKRTAQTNIGALQSICRAVGINFEEARTNALDGALVRRYEEAAAGRIERDGAKNMIQGSELRVRTTIESRLKQARSIFKRSHMNWFEDLSLPDLTKFREQGVKHPERPAPRPLDEGVIAQLNAAAPALAIADPPVYVAFLLFSRCGMRNGEIKVSRWSWIVSAIGGGGKLGVIYRPEENFKPKKKTERWIPLSASVLAELEKYRTAGSDFIVPALNKTERAKVVDRRHSQWAGQWIKDRAKVSYELRRYAGSLIYKKTGKIEHVQKFLGHADLKTTTDWYWYLLEETPAIEMDDFAPTSDCEIRIAEC